MALRIVSAAVILLIGAVPSWAQCPGGICPAPGYYAPQYSAPVPYGSGGCSGATAPPAAYGYGGGYQVYGQPSYQLPRFRVVESYSPFPPPVPLDPYRYAYRPLLRVEVGRPLAGRFLVRRWR